MPDVNISYKGSQIASMEGSGVKTLLTSGKYCEDDIFVSYNKIGNATAEGDSSVSVTDAESGNICSLIQYGVCEQDAQTNAISCNNGTLSVSSGEIVTTAANREAIALGSQTATVENLYSVGNIRDEQELVTGMVTRKNAACIYDGTQPVGDRYISSTGAKDNGAIIIYPLETEHTGDSIVSFTETVKQDVNSLEASIEPIQDLHGYDHPWPAGGGINKAKLVYKNISASTEYSNLQDNSVTVSSSSTAAVYRYAQFALLDAVGYAGQTLTFSAKAQQVTGSSNPRIIGRLYDSNGSTVGSTIFEKTGTSITHTFTLPATIDSGVTFRVNLYCNSANAEATETNFYEIQVEVSSTAHDFAPYENICPITGRTGTNVYVSPKNTLWSKYKLYVDTGAASEIFPVGKQITDTWKNTNGTEISFPWDVVHYTSGGDAFLKLHYAAPEALQFDAPEAIYYFDGTEPAGTYHIPIGSSYGTGWVAGHSFQFTLTAAPDEGDQLFIDCGTNNANDPAGGRAWMVYDAGGTTVKQSGTTSEGTGGTSLGTIGNVNAHRTNGRLNAISRVVYGYARWSQSAMRQYYNSDAAAGAWWTMQNPWDRPPTQAASLRGFLNGFSEDFLNHLEETEVVTALNSQEGLSETTEKTLDKIFLPSLEQMYINPELAGEGESWDYYKELAAGAGLTGMFQRSQTYAALITYNAASTSSAVNVFLRSCNRSNAGNERSVTNSGTVSNNYACHANRACPSCKFKKSTPNGTRYNVDWTSAAGTVYGGTLDVVTGVLTVDRAMVVIDGVNKTVRNNGATSTTSNAWFDGAVGKAYGERNIISDRFSAGLVGYVPGSMTGRANSIGVEFRLPVDIPNNTPALNQWFADNPTQLCYELATPITYQLTPQEVEVLVGTNNIFSPDATSIKVAVSNPVIEYVAPQPLTLAEGSNTVSATNLSVSSVPLELNYISKAAQPTSVAKKDVNFIDYDGTLLYSYTASEFANLSALPANPSHEGLVAQGWNWSLADAKTYVASYGKLWIGQMYITESGDTEIDIELHAPRLSPYLGIAVNGTVEVDWGDGSTKSTVTGTSLTTQVRTGHVYTVDGSYTIKIHVVSGSFSLYGTSTYLIFSGNFSNADNNRVYANNIKRVRIGSSVAGIGGYAFNSCSSLASITIPSSVTSIGTYAFEKCYALASITIPSGVTSIGTRVFSSCSSLASITIPSGVTSISNSIFDFCYSLASIAIPSSVTSIGTYAFEKCYALASITIPSGVTSIGNCAFVNCCGVGLIRFERTTPPTVATSSTWSNIPTDCIILIPYNSVSYMEATNYPSIGTYHYIGYMTSVSGESLPTQLQTSSVTYTLTWFATKEEAASGTGTQLTQGNGNEIYCLYSVPTAGGGTND